ncbi:hypothetical protein Ddye_008191 [Dipteronia dyeriana]|uniref:MULE transposase domain-containing protein n=1 Tax=Dipteronia dyeriana TaxID=168575 RepID=A0AAD9X969_9ROSI|nr:hypothetical protein Ddye_008191 [Dipteronia dyeriana]
MDATHLRSKTRGVLLVTMCKDGNEMIYPLEFGFANSECSKSWTWFLKQLRGAYSHILQFTFYNSLATYTCLHNLCVFCIRPKEPAVAYGFAVACKNTFTVGSYEGPKGSCYNGVVIVSYVGVVLECIFQCLREQIANIERTISVERANARYLTVENEMLVRKVDNLEAEIINLHVQIEERDNELNGLYTIVEKLQKKLLEFDIPPSL